MHGRIQPRSGKAVGTAELAGAELAAAAGARLMRVRRCRALGRLRAGPRDSPECTECNGELGCGLRRLWPRRRGAAAAMASAMVGNGATARERGGEERGNGEMLTVDPAKASAGSGKHWCGRSVVGDLGQPAMKTTRVATMEAVRRCVARRGGGGGRGGARGLYGGARGRRGARRW